MPVCFIYILNGKATKQVNECLYLYLALNSSLNWNTNIDGIVKHTTAKLCAPRKLLKYLNPKTKLTEYRQFIRPVLSCASVILM